MKNNIYICFPSFGKDPRDFNNQWIRKLSELLKILLNRLLTNTCDVVLCEDFKADKNKSIYSLFDEDDKLPLLVLPVSPEIIASNEFTKNLKKINEKYKENTEFFISRVYKVLMSPVSQKDQPDLLKKLRDYNIFDEEFSKENNVSDTYIFPFAPHEPAWLRLVDLAYDISDSLLTRGAEESESGSTAKKSAVFLAETTQDQENNRDNIKRELMHAGYHILPSNPLSSSPDLAKTVIIESLKQSELAIHIVGNKYGELMTDSDISLIEFQLDTVLLANKNQYVDEIIWLPPDLKPESDLQRQFIEKLRKTVLSGESSEVIQAPVEVLKTMVRKKLSGTVKRTKMDNKLLVQKERFIYIIHQLNDNGDIEKLISDIKKENIQFVDSDSLSSAENPVKQHRENLVACDGVLIHYSGDNTSWINSKLVDIVKAPGYGRKKPFRKKIILVRDEFKESIANIANADIVEMKNDFQQKIITLFR